MKNWMIFFADITQVNDADIEISETKNCFRTIEPEHIISSDTTQIF